MIDINEALRIVLSHARTTGTEKVAFTESLGRVLAADICSDIDMPPFNRSAVDGFACHWSDKERPLRVIATVKAGGKDLICPAAGECVRIMTGAPVPEGLDFVFPVEDSEEPQPGTVRFTGVASKTNISLKGEDVRNGDTVLSAPKLINPQDIAVMAAVGATEVFAGKQPLVGIISTGDELVEPASKPGLSGIRNSNAYQLAAQVERLRVKSKYYGIAPDDETETFKIISAALSECDVLLLTGGVSMGDFDFVPAVLERAGVKILFNRVNVQPGKPTTFGIFSRGAVFGLPGNPVSAFIQFETVVKPYIYQSMGLDWKPAVYFSRMGENYERKSASRFGWIPVKRGADNLVYPVEYHGSAHIAAFPYADGIVGIEPGKQRLEAGEEVSVRQI